MSRDMVHERYPAGTIVLANATAVTHSLLGAAAIMVAYSAVVAPPAAAALAAAYLVFALGQMYVLMPARVCRHCVYTLTEGARCTCGLNLFARRFLPPGDPDRFADRGMGALSSDRLFLVAYVVPILAVAPVLFVGFSWTVLALTVALVAFIPFRVAVLFRRFACAHCLQKERCPTARSVGVA